MTGFGGGFNWSLLVDFDPKQPVTARGSNGRNAALAADGQCPLPGNLTVWAERPSK
jgi:hypothetical protein